MANKSEWHQKIVLHNYVKTFGIEQALSELPSHLNLKELLNHCLAPSEAVLRIVKGDCCGRVMWFIRYESLFGSAGTVYFQHNGYSLVETIASTILHLTQIGVLNFDEYEEKLELYFDENL